MGRRTDWILNGATTLVTICALALVGVRLRFALRPDPTKPQRIEDAASYSASGHSMGPPSAAVTIVEFADYQCPFCRKADRVLTAIRDRHPHDVRVVYRHYPLAIHDSAVAAARAAECASLAGKFEPFHHLLFANAESIGQNTWVWFAKEAGITDTAGFQSCIARADSFPQIAQDRADGERLGVEGTPTFLINDLRVPGAIDLTELDGYVRAALAAAK